MKALCGITSVRLYDIYPTATAKATHNLTDSGLKLIRCSSTERAIEGAQIITTCTADNYATILTDNMVDAEVHINAIGGDCPSKTVLHRGVLIKSNILMEYPHRPGLKAKFSS